MSHYGTNLDILNFKSQFKALFWDFIWYCNIHSLDYSIILPYLKDLESAKIINALDPNREIFEVAYNDELYEQNLKKIEKLTNKLIYNSQNQKKAPFTKLVIKKEIEFELLKTTREEDDDNEEEEEEEDDLDDVDIDLNIPINKNIANSKHPVNIFDNKKGIQNTGLLGKLKIKDNEDEKE
jgi:hypothetical protein